MDNSLRGVFFFALGAKIFGRYLKMQVLLAAVDWAQGQGELTGPLLYLTLFVVCYMACLPCTVLEMSAGAQPTPVRLSARAHDALRQVACSSFSEDSSSR